MSPQHEREAAAPITVKSMRSATVVLAASNLAARSIGLFASFTAAVVLKPQALGEFALLALSAGVIGALASLGFPSLVTRAIAAAVEGREASEVATFVLRVSCVILAALSVALLALTHPQVGILSLPGSGDYQSVMVVLMWSVALCLNPLLLAVANGHRAFGCCAVAVLGRAVLVGAGTVLGCAVTGTAVGAAIGATAGELLTVSMISAYALKRRWLCLSVTMAHRGQFLRNGLSAGAASLAIQCSIWLGAVLLSTTPTGVVANGAFLLASKLVLLVTLLPNAISMAALPSLARATVDGTDKEALKRRVLGMTGISAIPAGMLAAFIGVVLVPRISPEYADFKVTFYVMALVGILMAANNVYGSIAVAEQRIQAWVASDWALATLMVGAAVILVPQAGSAGLALAHVVAYGGSVIWLLSDRRVQRTVGTPS